MISLRRRWEVVARDPWDREVLEPATPFRYLRRPAAAKQAARLTQMTRLQHLARPSWATRSPLEYVVRETPRG